MSLCVIYRCGPLFGPVIGGALTGKFGWRGTQWFLAVFGLVLLLMMTFCLPETLRKQPKQKETVPDPGPENDSAEDTTVLGRNKSHISTRSVEKTRQWAAATKHVLIDPLKSLKYLRFPPVLLTVGYASMSFGCLVCIPPPALCYLG